MNGVRTLERCKGGWGVRIIPRVRSRQIRGIFFEIFPAAHPGESYAEQPDFVSDAVLIPHAAHVFKQRELVSSSVKQLNGGNRGAVLIAARISEKKLQPELRKKSKIVILSGLFAIQH